MLERLESKFAARPGLGALAVGACLAAYALIVLQKSWVSDDAYITFRTAANLVDGFGPRWNPAERVQAYTHPMWMLVVAAVYAATRELYYTSIFLGLALSLAAVLWLALRIARSVAAACLAVVVLAASRAFTDFSTGGLENPLTHLLMAAFFAIYFVAPPQMPRLLAASTVASLLLLNRMDLALLVLPPLVVVVMEERARGGALRALLLGFLPFLLWEAFSLVYYGLLIPNSALAKLETGIGVAELVPQGLRYFWNSLAWDPVTLVGIAAGIALAVARRDRRRVAVAVGIGLYLVYVIRIGGDFMSGRFFTAPLFAAMVLVAVTPLRPVWCGAASIAAVLLWGLGAAHIRPVQQAYIKDWRRAIGPDGIVDERGFYENLTALRNARGAEPWPHPDAYRQAEFLADGWISDPRLSDLKRVGLLSESEAWPPGTAVQPSGQPYRPVVVRGAVGYLAYYLGPKVHVLDFHALGDPLLARLPIPASDPVLAAQLPRMAGKRWRIGHFCRLVPAGYVETLATGTNQIRDPDLAAYYDTIERVTRGPLFDPDRWRAIVRSNLQRSRGAART